MTEEELPDQDNTPLSVDDVYGEMEPLEPYTTKELSERLRASKGAVWSLLRRLAQNGRIRKKEPQPGLRIWIREPPAQICSNCGYEFEVKFLHPVLSSVQFCPRCGTQIE